MNIISYLKFGSVEFGLFTVWMIIGLGVLFIGMANKVSNHDLERTAIEVRKEPSSSPTSTKIELNLKINDSNELVIITLGEYYNIMDYSFFWDVVGERKEVTLERKTIFGPEQAILDFSLNKAFDSYGFEFCQLIEQYRELKNKKLAVCGLSERLKEVYFELDGKDYLEGAIVFSTLDDAMSYYNSEH
jgi:hypothetical protein